jgi:fibro-slime domain-containing protein
VAPVEGSCSNVCGEGTRTCENGAWGACRVPVVEEPCQNLCGSGTQRCENGLFGACEVAPQQRDCRSVCGPGHEACVDGAWLPCDAPLPKPPKLQTVVRDFRIDHPDFEIPNAGNAIESGIVAGELGPDDKPVYNGDPLLGTRSTTGPDNFYQWYNDVPGVNLSAALALDLASSTANPALFVYEDTSFFPIDDQLFGNETNRHNYHFTLEARTTFQYIGGEVFRFTGDDDMWVFINRRLAIDLGGLHTPRSASVDLDSLAGSHGLTPGGIYPLHFFFAERHTFESNFTIETSIAEPGSCE